MGHKHIVTGGAGFIGSHLVDYINRKENNAYVLILDDLSGGNIKNINTSINDNNVSFVQLDLDCVDSLENIFKNYQPDYVWHLACHPHEGLSFFSPIDVSKTNYQASINIFTLSTKYDVKKVIYTSSMSVYGDQDPPFTEDMDPRPIDIYALSKSSAEKALEIFNDVHNLDYTILRLHNVYGPRQNYQDPFRNVVSIFINLILLGKPIYIYGGGGQQRSFTYIDDCVPYIYESIYEKYNNEIFNVGPSTPITINELAEKLIEMSGNYDTEIIHIEQRIGEVQRAWCSNKKIKEWMNYKTSFSLDKGLNYTWDYIKSCGAMDFNYWNDIELYNKRYLPITWKEKIF